MQLTYRSPSLFCSFHIISASPTVVSQAKREIVTAVKPVLETLYSLYSTYGEAMAGQEEGKEGYETSLDAAET